MKKNLLLVVGIIAISIYASNIYAGNQTKNFIVDSPSVVFEKAWIDYDVTENNVLGMRIHVKFTLYDMKDVPGYVAVYFKEKNGKALTSSNKKFASVKGELALYKSIKPVYKDAVFTDVVLFLPYDELNVPVGKFNIEMDIDVIYENGDMVGHLTYYDFLFTRNKPLPLNTSTVSSGNAKINVVYKDAWIEYDVYENNKKGMRIHTKFSASNMKDIDGYMAAYFSKTDGSKLFSNNLNFRSNTGQLAIYKSIKPMYEATDFNDLSVFMPYEEITLPAGRHDLVVEINIIYKEGGLIKSLTKKEFWIQK